MRWVNAKDRLPKERGREHKVIVKYRNSVYYAWKNFAHFPMMLVDGVPRGIPSLTNDVFWLDEQASE